MIEGIGDVKSYFIISGRFARCCGNLRIFIGRQTLVYEFFIPTGIDREIGN